MNETKDKILLILPPFWMPLIPPLGIACLKSFLQENGYSVKTADGNTNHGLRETYDRYFNLLDTTIPINKKGNFHSIGQDVLRNHMMAHLNYTDEYEYRSLVQNLISKTFYTEVNDSVTRELNNILGTFYKRFDDYLSDLIEAETPTVLGLSMFSGTLPASYFAMKRVREKYPHIKIAAGGGAFADQIAIGTPNMDAFMEKAGSLVDVIIIGEGEELFLKFLKGELPGDKKVYTLNDIQWQIMNIKTAPPPDFKDFDLPVYPNMASYTSRSCPFQCSFCSETVQWGKYRKKTGKHIVRELVDMYRQYGRQLFFMSDSLLNPVLKDLSQEFIASGESIYWDGCIRADKAVCDPDNTMLWRQGGFYRARLGLESGSQKVLDLMTKKITVEQMHRSLECLAQAGIKASTLWLIGHPGETEEDFQKTLDFLESSRDNIYAAEGTPFWYHLKGQSNSDDWFQCKNTLLYPETAGDTLVVQTWILDSTPTREETYIRLNRFMEHIRKLGIPLPYSLKDIYQADERWTKLHKNAVPPLVSFKDSTVYIAESKTISHLNTIENTLQDDGDWGF